MTLHRLKKHPGFHVDRIGCLVLVILGLGVGIVLTPDRATAHGHGRILAGRQTRSWSTP